MIKKKVKKKISWVLDFDREGRPPGRTPSEWTCLPTYPKIPDFQLLACGLPGSKAAQQSVQSHNCLLLEAAGEQAYISHTYSNTSAYFLLVYKVTRQGPKLSLIFKMLLFKELPFIAIMGIAEQTTLQGGLQDEERTLWIFYLESLKTKLSGVSILRQ